MKNAVFATILLFVSYVAAQDAPAPRTNLHAGAVYVMSNQNVNSVFAFARDPARGTLALVDTEPTGGAGDPVMPVDPLGSQGSLAVDSDNEYIYAVNAGSNEISVLKVGTSSLAFVQKVSSGGTRPISLTIFGNWLYVLNGGGTPNITGFLIAAGGTLTPIAGSTQPLIGGATAAPAQVGFSADGTQLVVSEKMGNRLDTYTVDTSGVAGPPSAVPSNGMTPFGFAFNSSNFLFVSEAFGGAPNASAVSSYDADEDFDVVTGSLPNGQTAACWLVVTGDGRIMFVSNTGSGNISAYSAAGDGTLALISAVAADTGSGSSPIDMALTHNSRFLYVHEAGSQVVSAYAVNNGRTRGSLTFVGEFGTLPMGAQGIASK